MLVSPTTSTSTTTPSSSINSFACSHPSPHHTDGPTTTERAYGSTAPTSRVNTPGMGYREGDDKEMEDSDRGLLSNDSGREEDDHEQDHDAEAEVDSERESLVEADEAGNGTIGMDEIEIRKRKLSGQLGRRPSSSSSGQSRQPVMTTTTDRLSEKNLLMNLGGNPDGPAGVITTAGASKMALAAKKGKAAQIDHAEDDVEHPLSEKALARRGYQSHLLFKHVFHLEDRWTNLRELGQGAYGLVISAEDSISGERIAIKLLTRVFDKVILARRCLREITLMRHLNGHENITGLIDLDVVLDDFNEIYLFMEPMEADLHQIIRSGQQLTNSHICYFLYQILRGMKYVHSANVIHRDLKPGNLLVNADCELKICDFGLARGFRPDPAEWDPNSMPDGGAMTEYVATRWYRAPEIMLSFKRYSTAIDVWSIGCILAELLAGKPLFKGKDYIDQLNLILQTLGTPEEATLDRVGSERACQYIRSLPKSEKIPFAELFPKAEPAAVDLLEKMLTFDPAERITVQEALLHPYLAPYHDETDEPECPIKFDKWEEVEGIQSLADFRETIHREVEEFRAEVRTVEEWDSESCISGVQSTAVTDEESVVDKEDVPEPDEKVEYMPSPRAATVGTPKEVTTPLSATSELSSASHIRPGRARRSNSSGSGFGDPFGRRPSSMFGLGLGMSGMTPLDGGFREASHSLTRGHSQRSSISIAEVQRGGATKSRQGSTSSYVRPLLRSLSTLSVSDLHLATNLNGDEPPPMTVSASDAPPSEAPRTFGTSRQGSRQGSKQASPRS